MREQYRAWWREIHTRAIRVNNERQYNSFIRYIYSFPRNFTCPKCKKHMISYLERHPPENSINAFLWTWKFHNSVNNRLYKAYMPYDDAVMLYR